MLSASNICDAQTRASRAPERLEDSLYERVTIEAHGLKQRVLNSLDAKKQACDIEKSKDDGDNSVENISYGAMFSPYKSKLQRQFSEEDRKYENRKKRSKRLSELNWVEVINLDDSEDDEKEDELDDTADSSTNKKNG
ncbi:hypothetical protein Hdeb2414_s0003g00086371 [Helianthus debilis subsp. tardiflorus]